MRAWVAERFGNPAEVLAIRDVEQPQPGPDDVLIRVEATTIGNNDLDAIHGRWASLPVPAPFVPGQEVLGAVVEAGANAWSWIGKRVIGMPRGCYGGFADFAVLPGAMTFEVPRDMPVRQAAAMFWPFHLAWLGLFTRAGLKAGETVMIHSAAGGAGSAAIQLAVNAGARVIATVGSDSKIGLCRELGAEVVLNYTKVDLVKEVMQATSGRGVDVCFDGTGGDLTQLTWRCLNFNARHVIFGFSSGIEQTDGRPVLLRDMIFGNFSLVGVLLAYVDKDQTVEGAGLDLKASAFNPPSHALGKEVQEKLIELLRLGKIRTVVDRVAPFEQLPSALAAFERREVMGRVIVEN